MKVSSVLFIYMTAFIGFLYWPKCDAYISNVPNHRQQIPVIDKDKTYPKKILKLDEIADITYIPLETTPDILLDKDAQITYISDTRMLVYNPNQGDIFIFGINGKSLKHFNGRGPDSYNHIKSVVYDEKNKEVLILDFFSRRIFVYTDDGAYRRTLHIPDPIRPTDVYNFDDQSILVFDDKQYVNTTLFKQIPPTQPFVLLSKKDGSIVSKINVTMDKMLAKTITIETGRNSAKTYSSILTCPNNAKFGQEFILTDFSLDTVYLLKKDKTLVPLIALTPTVFSDHPKVVGVGMFTDRFISFCVYTWDIPEQKRTVDKGQQVKFHERYLMYDFVEEKIYETNMGLGVYNKIDIGRNMSADLFEASRLVDALKAGRLKGDLKRIVKKLDEEDNQVVRVIKYK